MKNLLTLLFCTLAATAGAQHIGGLYAGKLTNDSTHKEQQYELALSEYRGQITGYAYTTFVVRDTFYYSVKRVKAKRETGMLLVEDVQMLSNNFPQAPDKNVRQQMRIPLPAIDTLTDVNGSWNTTRTKNFYAIGGSMQLKRNNDSSQSALVRHLFDISELKPQAGTAVLSAGTKRTTQKTPSGPFDALAPVLPYTARAERVIHTLETNADSLVLSFYDNGVVDGDTISVFLNGANIIGKVRLTGAAARQTVRLEAGAATYRLMLVAENLGTIPPNTGLLVIQDGERRHQIHFTADLQTNAVITLTRKP